jgi:hypothetical protein
LNNSKDTTGASKENRSTPVPATAPIVTTDVAFGAYMGLVRQLTVVDDIQLDVAQFAMENAVLTEKSTAPKLRPVTVTDAEPLRTVLPLVLETRGSSNFIAVTAVPAIAETVTCTAFVVKAAWNGVVIHATEVELDQVAVEQLASNSRDDTVCSAIPKLRPTTGTAAPPRWGALSNKYDATGPSKEKDVGCVPAIAETVIATWCSLPIPYAGLQSTVVMEDHEAV